MNNLVEFQIEDGQDVILVEVEEPVEGATQRVSLNPDKLAYQASQSFGSAISKTIKPIASELIKNVRELQEPPNEVEVTFGLTMSMEAGAVVAKAKSDANFSVTLKWTR